jgi:hypothetical protein
MLLKCKHCGKETSWNPSCEYDSDGEDKKDAEENGTKQKPKEEKSTGDGFNTTKALMIGGATIAFVAGWGMTALVVYSLASVIQSSIKGKDQESNGNNAGDEDTKDGSDGRNKAKSNTTSSEHGTWMTCDRCGKRFFFAGNQPTSLYIHTSSTSKSIS